MIKSTSLNTNKMYKTNTLSLLRRTWLLCYKSNCLQWEGCQTLLKLGRGPERNLRSTHKLLFTEHILYIVTIHSHIIWYIEEKTRNYCPRSVEMIYNHNREL